MNNAWLIFFLSPTVRVYCICLIGRCTFSPSALPSNLSAQPFPDPGPTGNLSFGGQCSSAYCKQTHAPSPCVWRCQDMRRNYPKGCLTPLGRSVLSQWVQPLWIRAGCVPAGTERWEERSSPPLLSLNSTIWGPLGTPLRWGKLI